MTILLKSSRLLLRRPETGNLPSLERVFCDPDMMRYLSAPWTPAYVAEVCAEWRVDWGFELSWFVLPEHQRQGFAAEITAELLRFAFMGLGAERVVAETHPENRAAQRVLEKLGGVCRGERRHHHNDLPGFDTQVLWEFTPGALATGDIHAA